MILVFFVVVERFYLFTFDCAGSSLLLGLFSSCGWQGLLSSCHVGLLLLQSTGPRHVAFSSGGMRAQ